MQTELETTMAAWTNFRRLVGKSSEPEKGPFYSDSDMYK